jgi:phage shock protein A
VLSLDLGYTPPVLEPEETRMIFSKIGKAIRAQINKLANYFWTQDPIAQMQYEYDKSVEQMKEGRVGLEQYRGLVERVQRQVTANEKQAQQLSAKIKAYLQAGDRETAGQLAIQLQKVKAELAENQEQLDLHEKAYNNNIEKIKAATKKLGDVKTKIQKYEADLKMSHAEADLARLSQTFNFDVTTDFGELEQVVQGKIDGNRAKVRVAADLSDEGMEKIEAEKHMEKALAEDMLSQFEVEMGLKTPETANIKGTAKSLGPEVTEAAEAKVADPEKITT